MKFGDIKFILSNKSNKVKVFQDLSKCIRFYALGCVFNKIPVNSIRSTNKIPKDTTEAKILPGAYPAISKIGNPNKIAVVEPVTISVAAGVLKLGSTSLSNAIPVEAVPVNIPYIPANPSNQ